MRIARRYVIGGRVQGVGFRYFAYDVAKREGVAGWVRNLADGRVEAYAEGESGAVMRFEQEVRRGPALARVGNVDVWDEQPGASQDFNIRPTSA